jgi:YHS domain-containing protein
MFKAIGALRVFALAGVLAFSLGSPAGAVSVAFKGVVPEEAVGGLDAVELIDGNQVQGQGRFTYVYRGLQWRFANEVNKARFKANPDQYIK